MHLFLLKFLNVICCVVVVVSICSENHLLLNKSH